MGDTTRVAIYARVSTSGNGQDPEVQLLQLRACAEQRGWTTLREYVDAGFSGARDRRPALDEMLADARAGRFDVLAVWKLDRLFRSVKHFIVTLDELRQLGIAFVSVTEQIDVTTASGRMVFSVIAAMAEFERSLTVERVKAGIAKARASGKRLGRPQRWTVAQVEKATRLRAEGASWAKVAQSVGLPISTIRGALAERPAEITAA